MQKALYPMRYLNITQGWGVGTHSGTAAIDIAGKDAGIDNVFAPFDCKVKKIWNNGNTVWIESINAVEWANGTKSKATMSFTHDNNVSNLRVGQRIAQGTVFYQEGTAGNATGNNVHMECAKGTFVGTGWFLNRFGWWTINNMVKPNDLLWLNTGTIVKQTQGVKFKTVPKVAPKPKPKTPQPAPNTARLSAKGTATVLVDTLNVRNSPTTKSKVVGTYKKGQKFNYDSYQINDGYVWLSYVSWTRQRRYVAEGPNNNNPKDIYVSGGVS